MATQADTLTLAAEVVDRFSAPLRDLTRQLKAFSGQQQDIHRRGKRDVDDHWKSYRDLSKQVTETAASTKKLLTPAIETLGITSLTTLGSIVGTAALRSFGQSSQTLGFLRCARFGFRVVPMATDQKRAHAYYEAHHARSKVITRHK